jgi:hypothetical protein
MQLTRFERTQIALRHLLIHSDNFGPVRSRRVVKERVTPSCVCIGQGQPGAGKGEALLGVHKLVPATANHTTIPDAAALEALQESTLGAPGLSWQAGSYAVL